MFQRSQNRTLMQQSYRAFTLIELLVVISIIALLLSIMLPSLRAAKKLAQAVVCKSNLKQWGLCYSLYMNDWGGSFPIWDPPNHSYMESLRNYYDDINEMRTCPSAKKVSSLNPTGLEPLSFFGSTLSAWQADPAAAWLDDEDWGIGSYTENGWIRDSKNIEAMIDTSKEWVKLSSVKATSQVPLLLDGRWPDSHVESDLPRQPNPQKETTFYNIGNWSTIATYMMRRHKDGINGVMADMSVIHIKAEDLWSYKWHKQFETRRDVNLGWLDEGL